jgi:hypothetical protein
VFQCFLERAAEIHHWKPNRPWVRHPTGECLSQCPAHGNACGEASPREDSVVVVAAGIQDIQTAKEVFGSGAVADSAGDADETNSIV